MGKSERERAPGEVSWLREKRGERLHVGFYVGFRRGKRLPVLGRVNPSNGVRAHTSRSCPRGVRRHDELGPGDI